jgi:pimeloyl-ACP methyl ester carboxylesterase
MELEADLLNNLLAEMNIDHAILFGHSDGGTIALLTAAKYPERVKTVICEAGHIFVEEVTLKGVYDAWEAYKTTNLPERLQKYHGDKVETLFRAWTETWTRNDYRAGTSNIFKTDYLSSIVYSGEADEYDIGSG